MRILFLIIVLLFLISCSKQSNREGIDGTFIEKKICNCPSSVTPVCGSDGKEYGNECLARCSGVDSTAGKC